MSRNAWGDNGYLAAANMTLPLLKGQTPDAHTHTYTGSYSHDETHHWQECSCGAPNKESHTGGTATCKEQAVCKICGEKYGELTQHRYKTEWSSDESGHFYECSVCGDEKDRTAHTLVWKTDKEATVTEEGTKHEECSVCGYQNASQSIDKLAPNIIEGNDGNWIKGGKNGLAFRSDAAPVDFVAVLVDGEVIASDSYEKYKEEMVVELKPDYLQTLSEGEHTLTIRFASGDASTKFTIEAKPVSILWIILPVSIVAIGGAGAAIYFISKKKRH